MRRWRPTTRTSLPDHSQQAPRTEGRQGLPTLRQQRSNTATSHSSHPLPILPPDTHISVTFPLFFLFFFIPGGGFFSWADLVRDQHGSEDKRTAGATSAT